MAEPRWKVIDKEPAPNGVFDVLAKYWDAGLDRFLICRLTNCAQVEGRIIWGLPFPNSPPQHVDIVAAGYKPVMWAHIPKLPAELRGPND